MNTTVQSVEPEDQNRTMIFHTKPIRRILISVMFYIFLAVTVFMLTEVVLPLLHPKVDYLVANAIYIMAIPLFGAIGFFWCCLLALSSYMLVLNPAEKTYKFSGGMFPIKYGRNGRLEEFERITLFTRASPVSSVGIWYTGLIWRGKRFPYVMNGSYIGISRMDDYSKAEQYARNLAEQLNLPFTPENEIKATVKSRSR